MKRLSTLGLICAAALAAGCGVKDPYNDAPRATVTPAATRAAGAGSPEALVRRVADLSTNWTSKTIVARSRERVPLSVGTARDDFETAAHDTARDPYLDDAGSWSKATVETVELTGSGPSLEALIVVEQELGGRGVAGVGAQYRVITARLEHDGSRWAVAEWTPQP